LEELGGVRYIFLTHRDDVAEAHKYAKQSVSQRIIHRAELSAQRDAEIVIEGHEPLEFSPEYTIIPTPGHTWGHCVLLYPRRF
jgi:glyoxylase-like metal-dependent hydrolase (beta-lactamase superfamily II)